MRHTCELLLQAGGHLGDVPLVHGRPFGLFGRGRKCSSWLTLSQQPEMSSAHHSCSLSVQLHFQRMFCFQTWTRCKTRYLSEQDPTLLGNAPAGLCALAVRAAVLPQGRGTLDTQLMNPMHPGLLEEAQRSLGRDPVDLRLMLLHPRHSHAICSPHRICAAPRYLHCRCSPPRLSSEYVLHMQYYAPCFVTRP